MTRRARLIWLAAAVAVLVGTFVVTRGSGGPGVTLAEAAENAAGESVRFKSTIDTAELSMTVEGVSSADGSRARTAETVTAGGAEPLSSRSILIGDDIWSRSADPRVALPPGKRWIHMRETELPTQGLTPSEYARFLAESDDVEEAGRGAVLNREATRYRGLVYLDEIAEELDGESRERAEALAEQAGGGDGHVGLPVEAWISDDGLPLRIKVGAGTTGMTMDLLEYGVPVEVEPPPAETVVEESELDSFEDA